MSSRPWLSKIERDNIKPGNFKWDELVPGDLLLYTRDAGVLNAHDLRLFFGIGRDGDPCGLYYTSLLVIELSCYESSYMLIDRGDM